MVVKPRTKAVEVVIGASNCSVLVFGKSTFLSRLLDQWGRSVPPVPKARGAGEQGSKGAREQGSKGAGEEFERVGYFCQPTTAILMEEKTGINHQDSQLGKTLDKKGNIIVRQ